MTKTKFKPGMRAIVASDKTGFHGEYLADMSQLGFCKGQEIELVEYDPTDESWLVRDPKDEENEMWIKRRNLKPVDEQQPRFKVGDRVRVLDRNSSPMKIGSTGVVTDVNDFHNVTVLEDEITLPTYGRRMSWFFKDNHLEPVKEDATKEIPLHAFREGDRVTLVRTTSSFYELAKIYIEEDDLSVGDTYTVEEINNNGNGLKNGFLQLEGYLYNIPYDCFEPAKEDTSVKPKGWKVGDRFTITPQQPIYTIDRYNEEKTGIYVTWTGIPSSGVHYTVEQVNDHFSKGLWDLVKDEPKGPTKATNRKLVLCVDDHDTDLVTAGRTYEVLEEEDEYYRVIDNLGDTSSMYKRRFGVLGTGAQQDKLKGFLTELEALIAKYK